MTLPLASMSGDRFLEANPVLLAAMRLHILTRPGEEDQQPMRSPSRLPRGLENITPGRNTR